MAMKSGISTLKIALVCLISLMGRLAQAEKLEFSNTVGPSATTCYLENMSETV